MYDLNANPMDNIIQKRACIESDYNSSYNYCVF